MSTVFYGENCYSDFSADYCREAVPSGKCSWGHHVSGSFVCAYWLLVKFWCIVIVSCAGHVWCESRLNDRWDPRTLVIFFMFELRYMIMIGILHSKMYSIISNSVYCSDEGVYHYQYASLWSCTVVHGLVNHCTVNAYTLFYVLIPFVACIFFLLKGIVV